MQGIVRRLSKDETARRALLCVVATAAALLPATLCADPAAAYQIQHNAIELVFCNVVSILQGATGKAIATLCAVTLGVGALLGKISWGMALIFIVGMALVFGASSIVSALGGDSSGCSYTSAVSST